MEMEILSLSRNQYQEDNIYIYRIRFNKSRKNTIQQKENFGI
jgi:hypothetical protein